MYFAKITNSHNSKNRLQEYISTQLRQLECLTVENTDDFKKHLESLVHRANSKFPRCRPLNAYLRRAYTDHDFSAGVNDVIQFSLYAQRGIFGAPTESTSILSNEGLQAELFVAR